MHSMTLRRRYRRVRWHGGVRLALRVIDGGPIDNRNMVRQARRADSFPTRRRRLRWQGHDIVAMTMHPLLRSQEWGGDLPFAEGIMYGRIGALHDATTAAVSLPRPRTGRGERIMPRLHWLAELPLSRGGRRDPQKPCADAVGMALIQAYQVLE